LANPKAVLPVFSHEWLLNGWRYFYLDIELIFAFLKMSRSFYVDSLIVKKSPSSVTTEPTITNLTTHSTTLPSIGTGLGLHRHHHPALPPDHGLSCYPRHPADMLSLCCPICVHAPTSYIPESSIAIPLVKPHDITTSSVSALTAYTAGYGIQRHHEPLHVKHQQPISPVKSPNCLQTDTKRNRFSNIGK